MLPETFAPAAEILPSDTVSVELAEGSQPPAFVTMVTFQVPSNGCWAKAEVVAEVVAVVTRPITKKAVPMRLRRMNQSLNCVRWGGLNGPNVSKFCRAATSRIVPEIPST